MFIKLRTDTDKLTMIAASEICLIGAMAVTSPKIFTGSVIGFKNGQTVVVKEKPQEVAELIIKAVKTQEIQGSAKISGGVLNANN